MPKFKIHHVTKYAYEAPVRDSANQIVLFPIRDEYQEVLKQELLVTGEPPVEIYKDYYGNEIGSFMQAEPHNELIIDSKLEVITKLKALPLDEENFQEQWNYLMQIAHKPDYIDFLNPEHFNALQEVKTIADIAQFKTMSPLESAKKLNEYVFLNFQYIKGITSVETTIDEVWKLKAGVCQDFAHVLLIMLRIINIPSRYVSGYICPNKNGMRGEGATHAWVDAYIPNYGWLGLDPTNNCVVTDRHVRLAVGRNFSDCSPVKGTYKGTSNHVLEVGVSVSYEDGTKSEEAATVLTPQPKKTGEQENSYRKYMEMMQQQQ
jgi:transglutaminase-like putative cysteine protease